MEADDPMQQAVDDDIEFVTEVQDNFSNRFLDRRKFPVFDDQIKYTGDTFKLLAKQMTRHLIDALINRDLTEG